MTNEKNEPSYDFQTICRFVVTPFRNCHCVDTTSSKVTLALYFCGGHYEECSIYRQQTLAMEEEQT